MSANGDIARFSLIKAGASELDGLIATVRRLSTTTSLQEIMDVVTHAARALLHADGITFVLKDGHQCYYAEEDAISPLWKGKRFPMEACISGWCMSEARAAVIPDTSLDPRIPQDAYRPTFVRSLAMVPVRQDDPVAAVGAYWASVREISASKVDLLQAIANAAALALARVELDHEGARRVRTEPTSQPAHPSALLSAPPGAHDFLPSRMRRWLFSGLRPHSPEAYAVAIVSVSLATMARVWLDVAVGPGVSPFVVYAPAVLISALVAGWPSGVLALAYGGVLAWWLFLPPYFSFVLDESAQGVSLALYVISSGLMVWLADTCRRAFHAIAEEQGRRTLLLGELRHRMKNTFAVIQAIVRQSLRASPEEARKINGRISAVLACDELVAGGGLYRTDMRSILTSELEPYGPDRCELHGDPISLPPDHARALALVVHELATNAAKYGAFSVPEGRLHVSWSATPERIQVTWSECGGPPKPKTSKRGFGSSFAERLLAGVGGTIAREFEPDGLVCRIELMLPEMQQSGL